MNEWLRSLAIAWNAARAGDMSMSARCYDYCNELAAEHCAEVPIRVNAQLSALRHIEGTAEGIIESVPPTEDLVISTEFERDITEDSTPQGMTKPVISKNAIRENIWSFDFAIDDHLTKNTQGDTSHIMVMSTGRCGTVSLYRLFDELNYLPYHTYFYHVPFMDRIEMMCRFMCGLYNDEIPNEWLRTRSAEWIGAENIGQPMVALNHMDTVFAPVFAKMHPKAKFIHLRRDPVKVFESFYSKGQWSDKQLNPVYYSFESFRFRYARYDLPATIAWYIKFTETFARAFGEVYPERYIEINSDKLFQQDDQEIKRLSDFIGQEIDRSHFTIPYNQKLHKITLTDAQIEAGREAFKVAYAAL